MLIRSFKTVGDMRGSRPFKRGPLALFSFQKKNTHNGVCPPIYQSGFPPQNAWKTPPGKRPNLRPRPKDITIGRFPRG